MSSLSRDPLTDTDRVLVDGTNLLHAISRQPEPAPPATLIGRLRGTIPGTIGIELILDGMPGPGMRGERVASGLIVRHAGRRTADELLLSLVEETRATAGPEAAGRLLVVTDDLGLRSELRARGARTAGAKWLLERLDQHRLRSPSVGNKRSPSPPGKAASEDGESRPGWKPGRGATTKRGNPRRGRPSSGRMPT